MISTEAPYYCVSFSYEHWEISDSEEEAEIQIAHRLREEIGGLPMMRSPVEELPPSSTLPHAVSELTEFSCSPRRLGPLGPLYSCVNFFIPPSLFLPLLFLPRRRLLLSSFLFFLRSSVVVVIVVVVPLLRRRLVARLATSIPVPRTRFFASVSSKVLAVGVFSYSSSLALLTFAFTTFLSCGNHLVWLEGKPSSETLIDN